MGLSKIVCCKCHDPLPFFVIFPCGHLLCDNCKTLKKCQECQQPVVMVKDTLSLQYFRTTSKDRALILKDNRNLPSSTAHTPKPGTSKVRNRSSLSFLKLITPPSSSSKNQNQNNGVRRPTKKTKINEKTETTVKQQIDLETSQEGDDVFIDSASRKTGKKLIRVQAVVHAPQGSDSSQNTQEDECKERQATPKPSPQSDFVGFDDDLPSQIQLDNFMSFLNKPPNIVPTSLFTETEEFVKKSNYSTVEPSKSDATDHCMDESLIGPSLPPENSVRRSAKKRKLMDRLRKEHTKTISTPKCIPIVESRIHDSPNLGSSGDHSKDFIDENVEEQGLEPMELSRSCCNESVSPEKLQDIPSMVHFDENNPLSNGNCATVVSPSALDYCINNTSVNNRFILKGPEPRSPYGNTSNELPRYRPTSVESLSKANRQWYIIHNQLSQTFSKLYETKRPESLAKLAFDVLLLPLKNKEIFQGCEKLSPITESAMKGVQVDLFMEQSTVKVDYGREPAKRNSLIRRQLSFIPEESFVSKFEDTAAESEDIVEGTPTKDCTPRVHLLNDSLRSPSSKDSQMYALPLISDSQESERVNDKITLTPQTVDGRITPNVQQPPDNSTEEIENTPDITCEKIVTSCSPRAKRSNFEVSQRRTTPTITELARRSSFIYNDSDSIICDTEQICQRKKSRLALPLNAHSIQNLLEGTILLPPSPQKVESISEITSSGLYSKAQLEGVKKLCTLMEAKFNNSDVTRDTSHLIIPEQGTVNVTAKFLMALYIGAYILPFRYVADCLRENRILNEVGYIPDHPGIKRRIASPKNSYLFENYAFYVCPEIGKNDSVNYDALKKLLTFCNCKTSETEEDLITKFTSYRRVILKPANYSQNPTNGCSQLHEVNYQWFYASLSSYQIQPFEKPLP